MRSAIIRTCAFVTLLSVLATDSQAQLGVALNATNLSWTTSGTSGASSWSVQSGTTHDGLSAAQSGTLSSSSQTSTVQTTVTGPGKLTFWWLTPSVENLLSFFVGTTNLSSSSGIPNWQELTFYFGPGIHALKWTYSYRFSGGFGQRSYLDQVTYTPGAVAPTIISQPPSQSQVAGLNASFSVGLAGTPPFSYQWRFNDAAIPGATASSFTVTNIQATNLGYYNVVVTNAADSTISSNALLEFGNVTAWGMMDPSGPATVTNGASNVLAVACGAAHSLALTVDGALIGWGDYIPTKAPPGLTNLVAIAAGGGYSMALRPDGRVIAWGDYYYGATNVPADLSNAVAIAAGGSHGLALRADGTAIAWGDNFSGETNVPAGLTNLVAIAAGLSHSLALKRDGTVVAWGNNSGGVLNVPLNLTNAVGIAAGFSHSLALRSDGTVAAWGNNLGQMPTGLTNAVAITAGFFYSMALKADGTVVAWGSNTYGQTNVPTGLTNVVAIAAGGSHNLAMVGDGPPIQASLAVVPTFSGNGFSLTLPSQSGRVFALEYKDSLAENNWTTLPLVAGTGRMQTLTDPTGTNTHRFYRVRRW